MDAQMEKFNEAKKALQEIQVQEVITALKKRQADATFVPNKEAALQTVLSLIPEGSKVGYGGSLTLDELGIKEALKKGNYQLIDRGKGGITEEELFALRREGLLSDVFLCSTNALTRDGKMVNIDGSGNRLSALTFGPKKIIVVAGVNKIVEDVERGLDRVRNYVAPLHARRRDWDLPCAKVGRCVDCRSPRRICCTVTITEFQRVKNRTTVVLVGETLGI